MLVAIQLCPVSVLYQDGAQAHVYPAFNAALVSTKHWLQVCGFAGCGRQRLNARAWRVRVRTTIGQEFGAIHLTNPLRTSFWPPCGLAVRLFYPRNNKLDSHRMQALNYSQPTWPCTDLDLIHSLCVPLPSPHQVHPRSVHTGRSTQPRLPSAAQHRHSSFYSTSSAAS